MYKSSKSEFVNTLALIILIIAILLTTFQIQQDEKMQFEYLIHTISSQKTNESYEKQVIVSLVNLEKTMAAIYDFQYQEADRLYTTKEQLLILNEVFINWAISEGLISVIEGGVNE